MTAERTGVGRHVVPAQPTGNPEPSSAGLGRVRTTRQRVFAHGVPPLLVAGDLMAVVGAGTVAQLAPGRSLLLAVTTTLLYRLAGLYRSRLTFSLLDDLPALVGRAVVAAAVLTTLDALWRGVPDRRLLQAGLHACVLVLVLREIVYALVRRLRSRRVVAHRTLVLGAGQVGVQLARLMLEHPSHGLQPVGFLDDRPLLAPDELALPLLGAPRDLAATIVDQQVTVVAIAFGALREPAMVDVLRTCDRLRCEIFYVPRLFELAQSGPKMDQLWGLPLLRLPRAAFRTPSWRCKRLLDVVLAALALLLLSPLMAAIALAVRLESGPGVLFRQERVGLDGRVFLLLKFRSLRPESIDESQTTWTIAADARVRTVGRLLRRTSLDELPQLINVLRGDMSLVGPRPERPHFVSAFTQSFPRYPDRHRVPSGLTGWAQVHGLRGDTSIADRARFDNYYIENWSVWTDIKILLRTVPTLLQGQGR